MSALKWSLMLSRWWGVKVGHREKRGDLCLSYIPILSLTGVSMQLCGRVHLHTERRRKEDWEKPWYGGGRQRGKKKLMPARHPVSGRFWLFIVLNTASSVCLSVPVHVRCPCFVSKQEVEAWFMILLALYSISSDFTPYIRALLIRSAA